MGSAIVEPLHPTRVEGRAALPEGVAPARPAARAPSFATHGDFVFRSLQRLGVRASDALDMTQEVFLVAHRRADDRRGTSGDRTWLFGICLRVASDYRKRAFRRRELLVAETPEPSQVRSHSPEELASRAQARAQLEAILDTLSPEQRVAFVMFEVEGLTCPEIAEQLGWPLGTVFTRIRRARLRFEAAVEALRGERGTAENGGPR